MKRRVMLVRINWAVTGSLLVLSWQLRWAVLDWVLLWAVICLLVRAARKHLSADARWRRNLEREWPAIADAVGLTRLVPDRIYDKSQPLGSRHLRYPALQVVNRQPNGFALTIDTLPGQTTADALRCAAALRDLYGTSYARGAEISSGRVRFEFGHRDPLQSPESAVARATKQVRDLDLGRTEDGNRWQFRLTERHTLIVGCSGSGKGSVFWGIACGLAPAVRAGLVELHGIDLKMGMELSLGAELFTSTATDQPEALELVQDLIHQMHERGRRMRGQSRKHIATTDEPLVVLMIDELATLSAYSPDAAARKQFNEGLSRLLTQGRAVGFVVVGCLQDPRKEALPMRNLFTQTIALRLRSRDEVTMALGVGMGDKAPADQIRVDQPGVAYSVNETGSVTRVRADYWSDDLIRQVATSAKEIENV